MTRVVAVHHEWLPSWLTPSTATESTHVRHDYREGDRPADTADKLARMVAEAKSNSPSLTRLLSRVGWMTTSARLQPSKRPQLRHGDFGEVLAIGVLDAFEGIPVPVMKLRVQMDPEQSLHGADVVGFCLTGPEHAPRIEALEFVEVKCQTTRHKNVLVAAHSQLSEDAQGKFQDTLEFIFQRLEDTRQDVLLAAFEDYLASRDEGPGGSYRIVAVSATDAWQGDEIAQLLDSDELLEPLCIDVILIDELAILVADTWSAAGSFPLEVEQDAS